MTKDTITTIPTVTTRGQARVQKRSAGARETKLPVPIVEKRNRQHSVQHNAIATMSNTYHSDSQMQEMQQIALDASFDKSSANNNEDWAEQVEREQNEKEKDEKKQQEPADAFDWARSLQQQISAQGRQISMQAEKLAQHHEILTQLQDLMKENAQLKSDLAAQRDENSILRKELHALRNDTQHHTQHSQVQDVVMETDEMDSSQDEIGKACDTVAFAMSKVAQEGSSVKDSRHAPPPSATKAKVSYANVAKKNMSRAQKRRHNNVSKPTEGMVSWATRLFANDTTESNSATNHSGYTIVYLNSTHRSQHSETRKALAILGVPQGRIIDVHFPVRGIIGLLIHKSFEKDLVSILQKAKLKINTEFEPQSAASLRGTQYNDLSEEKRKEQAEQLFTDRMLRTCARMPKAHLGAAIIRHFVHDVDINDRHHMPPSTITRFDAMRPRKIKSTPAPVPTVSEARKILGLPEIDAESNDEDMDQ